MIRYTLLMSSLVLAVSACSTIPRVEQANNSPKAPELVRADGTYPVVTLEKDTVVLKVIQHSVKNLQDFDRIEEGLEVNLKRMVEFAERACSEGSNPDFLLFNEFPLTGYSSGPRSEKLKFTIEVPGPETAALGEVAKACDTYLIFGSYARDKSWPNHILSINTVIGRDGEIAAAYWKTRNVKRLGGITPGEIPTTTVENVRDRYRARYGIEQEFPVLRTEFGNIAVSTVQLDPFAYAAYAMRGVEIMLRTATLFSVPDVQATALFNRFYSAMSNITFPVGSGYEKYGGGSLIVGPDGKIMVQDESNDDSIIEAQIHIAEFRANRTIPRYPLEVVAPVFEQYQQEIPLNHLDLPNEDLPQTREAMKALMDNQSRWLNR